MSLIYYRFHLSSKDIDHVTQQHYAELCHNIPNDDPVLGVVRTAIDYESDDKTICILCHKNKDADQQTNLLNYLTKKGILVSTTVESEEIEDDEHHEKHDDCHHQHHTHDHTHHDHCHTNHGHNHKCDGHNHKSHDHNHKSHDHNHKSHDHNHKSHDHSHKRHDHSHKSHDHNNKSHDHSHKSHDHDHHGHHHDHNDDHWLKAGIGLAWGVGLLILSLVSLNIPMLAYYILTGISSLITLYLGSSVYLSAWRALREKRWDMSTLYSISTLAIVVVSILSIFVPGLPLMFETAPLVLGFWHLGEGIEHTLLDKINTKLDVRDCLSPYVKLKSNPEQESPVKTLIPNDIIIINAGEVIPVDGVLKHSALLFTIPINGSPSPTEFKAGAEVKAGMHLPKGSPSIELRVTRTYLKSYLSSVADNIKKANDEKAPIERFANKILKYFVPGLLAVAIASGIVIGIFFSPALAIQCVISVLVSACPCTLSLITPLAVKIGMKKAAEQGVQFKNAVSLQAAAEIDTVVFDLNGTLTQGDVSVKEITVKDNTLLARIALLQSHSAHPIAKIIKTHIEQQDIVANEPLEITDIQHNHSGIKGTINGETYMIGNQDMLKANGISELLTPEHPSQNGSIDVAEDSSVVYIVKGLSIVGRIYLTDPLRKDAIETVKELKARGIQVHMCTGADKKTAKRYADSLGIPDENICANTIGVNTGSGEASKTDYINSLKKKGYKVAMVGDAGNDIAAICQADIGIAVSSNLGDLHTLQNADIVVQKGVLFPIVTALDAAQKTKTNIYQNLFVSLAYNTAITLVAAGLFVAIGFALNPVIGIALMVLESTIVLANLYRLKKQDVITAESTLKNASNEEEVIEETTPKVMQSLGHQHQPELEVEAAPAPSSPSNHRSHTAKGVHTFFSNNVVEPTQPQVDTTDTPLVKCA